MRTDKALRDLVDSSLATVGGSGMPLVIVTEDEAESRAVWDLLKGRRGGKSITLRVARSPKEFRPMMDLVRERKPAMPEKAPAPTPVLELDYDGY